MSIKIRSTKDTASNGIKVLVYGKAGVGKTTLMGTAPRPIILSCESGLLSLKEKDLPYIEIKSVTDIYEAYEYLKGKKGKRYKTICLDSVSEIADVVLAEFKKKEKDGRQAYMKMADEMFDLIRKFRDLKRKNVVFSAKRQSTADADTGLTQYIPGMPGQATLNFLPYQFDELFYMTFIEGNKGKKRRILLTETSYEYEAKDRSGVLNKREAPNLTKIFKKIQSTKEE